jgi:hypothetical protein
MGQLGGGDGAHRLAGRLGQLQKVGTGLPLSLVQLLMPLLPLASLPGATALVSLLMAITSLFILTPVV